MKQFTTKDALKFAKKCRACGESLRFWIRHNRKHPGHPGLFLRDYPSYANWLIWQAIKRGNIELLNWLHKRGVTPTKYMRHRAEDNGYYASLRWYRKHRVRFR